MSEQVTMHPRRIVAMILLEAQDLRGDAKEMAQQLARILGQTCDFYEAQIADLRNSVNALLHRARQAEQALQSSQAAQAENVNTAPNSNLTDAPSRTRTLNPLIKSQQPDATGATDSQQHSETGNAPADAGGESADRALGDAHDVTAIGGGGLAARAAGVS